MLRIYIYIYIYNANIDTLSCHRSKRNVAAAEAEGAASAVGRTERRPGGAGRVAAGGQARATPLGRNTRANTHELASNEECTPVFVGLAGMVQEQPATGLAGIVPAEICRNMQEICKEYAGICKKYERNMQIDTLYQSNMQKICTIYIYIYMKYA